jgi:hypothetical protein
MTEKRVCTASVYTVHVQYSRQKIKLSVRQNSASAFCDFNTSFEAACVKQALLHKTGDAEELNTQRGSAQKIPQKPEFCFVGLEISPVAPFHSRVSTFFSMQTGVTFRELICTETNIKRQVTRHDCLPST